MRLTVTTCLLFLMLSGCRVEYEPDLQGYADGPPCDKPVEFGHFVQIKLLEYLRETESERKAGREAFSNLVFGHITNARNAVDACRVVNKLNRRSASVECLDLLYDGLGELLVESGPLFGPFGPSTEDAIDKIIDSASSISCESLREE